MRPDCFAKHAKLAPKDEHAALLADVKARGGDDAAKIAAVKSALAEAESDHKEIADAIAMIVQPGAVLEIEKVRAAENQAARDAEERRVRLETENAAKQSAAESTRQAQERSRAATAELEAIRTTAKERMDKADPAILARTLYANPTVEDWMTPEEKRRSEVLKADIVPATVVLVSYADSRLSNPDLRTELSAMAGEAGWSEIGGHIIRDPVSNEVTGRTPWVPRAWWWTERPDKLNKTQVSEAVRKALADEKLKVSEIRTVKYMLDMAEHQLAEGVPQPQPAQPFTAEEMAVVESLPESQQVDALEIADSERGKAPDNWATMSEGEQDAELDAIFGEATGKTPAPGGQESSAGTRAPNLELTGESPAELRVSEATQAADAARKRAVANAPSPESFNLTGSDRAADEGAAAGQGDIPFSRAPKSAGMRAQDITAALQPILAKWKNAPEVVFIQSMADAPKRIQDYNAALMKDGASGTPQAFFDSGKVYLVGDAINSTQAAITSLFHETIGHYGLRGAFGEALKPILGEIGIGRKSEVDAKIKEYGLSGSVKDRLIAAEEVLANLAQTKPELGIVKRAIASVRNWLRSHGVKLEWSDNDLVQAFILPARRFVESGGKANVKGATAFSLVPEWVSSQPADTQEALRKAGIWHQQPTLKERVKDWSKDWQQRMKQGMVDQFDPIKNYDFKAYMLARMSKSSDAALEGVLMNGTVFLDKDGAVDVNYEKGGFLGIMSKLQNEHDRFLAWVVGNRAERLLAEGKEHNFTAADIARLKALNQGTMPDNKSRPLLYETALNGLRRYNKSVMDMAEQAGLIDPDSRSVWEKDFYVPFYRMMEMDRTKGPTIAKGLVRQYAFKTLKGGSEVIGDPLENILKNWSHLIDASLKNQAAKESVLAAENVGAALEAPEEAARQMAKTIGKKDAVIHFMDKGIARYFIIDDPFLLDALQSIGFSGFQGVGMKAMQKFKHWLTLGVTISPTFRIRNIIRDSLTMIGTNPASYNVLNNIATGWKMAREGDPYYASIIAGGGVMRYGTHLEGDRAEHVKRLIEAGVEDNTILNTPEKVKAMLQQAWDWWAHIGDRSENVNRVALYKTLRDQGKSHLEASYAARDTMDFSMQGTWAAIRFLAQTVPFFNARLQGLYKLGRGAYADPQRFAYVVGAAAIASIALLLAYRDDDDWKRREDFDRESYWWFKIGDKAFRIPKPFEIGAIGTLAERAVEVMISDELTGKQFLERMSSVVTQQLSMNPIPQLVKPIIETWANKDFFTDRPIEPMGMEKLSTAQRIGPNTSGVARILGKAGLVSPVQIDHLISAYFGWLGTHIVMTADLGVKPAIEAPEKAAARVDEMFVVGDFIKDLPAHESRYITHLYDQSKRVQESMADYRQALETKDAVRAKEILQDQADRLKLAKLYTSAASHLSEINRQIKTVQNGQESPDVKRDRLEKLYVIRSAMAKATEERSRQFQR